MTTSDTLILTPDNGNDSHHAGNHSTGKHPSTATPDRERSANDSSPLRILVVDDETPSRTLLSHYLKKACYSVAAVDGGPAALEALAKNDFDLMITDRAMPGMGGDELAQAAKSACPAIRTLMLTGGAKLMPSKDDVPPDFDAVLTKPITAAELLQAIARIMKELP